MLMEFTNPSSTLTRVLVLVLKELADLIAGLAGLDDIEPVTTLVQMNLIGDTLNLVTRFQLGSQRNHTVIILG